MVHGLAMIVIKFKMNTCGVARSPNLTDQPVSPDISVKRMEIVLDEYQELRMPRH